MATAARRPRTLDQTGLLTGALYGGLGAVLLWSRLVGLDRSYASDELTTVLLYVREGIGEIVAGTYVPNNHELFSIIGWATTELVGESAVALRLWSVVPFVCGVALVSWWLHSRVGPPSGVLFLAFSTLSPLLLDITRQARGYGIAYLAMSVLVVAALEAIRWPRTAMVVALCVAGIVGTLTLPHFVIAFVATCAVLATVPALRRVVAIGLGASLLAIVVFYAPHLDDLVVSSRQDYAAPIGLPWIVTAPIDQTLLPALSGIDEVLVDSGLGSLVLALALAAVISASPLLRKKQAALVLLAGVVATVVTFWATRTNVAPRYLSFLLVPLFVLLATGSAAILARFVASGRPIMRTPLVVCVIAFGAIEFAHHVERVARLPREAVREAAALIRARAPASSTVVTYVPYPRDFEYYLGRRVIVARTPAEALRVCDRQDITIFVSQPWALEPVVLPCLTGAGIEHHRLDQYARGGRIDVWVLPAQE